jgi:hypothetical protein
MRCLVLNPIEPDGEPTPLFNNTMRGWVWLTRATPA